MIRVIPILKSLKKTTSSNVQLNIAKASALNYIFENRTNDTYLLQHHCPLHQSVCQLNTLNLKEDIPPTNETNTFGNVIKNGPSLKDFIISGSAATEIDTKVESIPYIPNINGTQQKVYFEVYGCQMNVNDTEVAWSILKSCGYGRTNNIKEADIVLVVTCSIREGAEQKIWGILRNYHNLKVKRRSLSLPPLKVGVLGCMAERLKEKILEKERTVDIIAGPDSYKDLPRLLANADNETAINVVLSFDETYADVMPVRLNPDSSTAFVTIMRGCDNMCTYCIVPFTRGRERSRPIESILREVQELSDQGIREVTLLGQNVNSYRDLSESQFYTGEKTETQLATGFKTVYKKKKGGLRFVDLLDKVSLINPDIRIRFTSPHPKDFPDEVLHLVSERPNICKCLHVPAQSGNSAVLERMRRGYTREAYLELIDRVREVLPNACLTTDMICGFCGETEEEFEDSLSLMDIVKYNSAYLFAYSMREKTTAHRRYKDDVKQEVKIDRLKRMWTVYRNGMEIRNKEHVGQTELVYIETLSKRSNEHLRGRNDGNMRVIIPALSVPIKQGSSVMKHVTIGDFVAVKITDCSSEVLKGVPLYHSSVTDFAYAK